ncbi:hypothetical protein HUU05_26900 [candidate division KSB1 bacterium]|nr:hypothetical protein [candidate division KSB1 bacterium]
MSISRVKILQRVSTLLAFVAVAAFAQSSALQIARESAQSRPRGAPQSDEAGTLWTWRNEQALLISARPSTSSKEITGTFLQHRVNAGATAVIALEKLGAENLRDDKSGLALRWFNRDGQPLGTHFIAWHNDDPLPQFVMNRSGSHVVCAEPAVARATFLDQTGQVLAQNFLFEDATYSNERPLFLAASAEHFYVLSQRAPSTLETGHAPVLFCFSLEGQEQWRRELAPGTAGNLALSPRGNWLMASRYTVAANGVVSTIAIFDTQGHAHATLSGLFRTVVFARDETQALLLDRRQLRCVRIPQGERLWQFALTSKEEMFVAAAATHDLHSYIVLAAQSNFKQQRFIFEQARLLAFDHDGQHQFELAIPEALVQPALAISASGRSLQLAGDGLFQNYKLIVPAAANSTEQ